MPNHTSQVIIPYLGDDTEASPNPSPVTPQSVQLDNGSFMERAADTVGGALTDAYDFVSGESRREQDLPELPGRFSKYLQDVGELFSTMSLARNDAGKADIFRLFYPDAPIRTDKFDNVIVNLDGKDYFLNAPGPSAQDASDLLVGTAFELAGARLGGGTGKKFLQRTGDVLGTSAGLFGGAVAQDMAAQETGSQQPIDYGTAAMVAATGGASQALAPVVRRMTKSMRNLYREVTGAPAFFAEGRLTEQGRKALQDGGVDPADVSDTLASYFAREGKNLIDPAMGQQGVRETARFAESQTLPVPVPLSRGDITRGSTDRMYESEALKGSFGEGASRQMAIFRINQRNAMMANVERMGDDITETGSGFGAAQRTLSDRAEKQKKQISKLYKEADTTTAGVRVKDLTRVGFELDAGDAAALVRNSDVATKELEQFRGLYGERGPDDAVLVSELFKWRRGVTKLAGTSNNPTDRNALGALLRNFDNQAKRLVENDLVLGDPFAPKKWLKAVQARRAYADEFESDKFMEKILSTTDGTLDFTPEEVGRAILAGGINFKSKQGVAKNLRILRDKLGAGSDEFNQIRREVFERIIDTARKKSDIPYDAIEADMLSGALLRTNLDKIFKEAPEVMGVLFTPTQIKQMQQLTRVAETISREVRGGANFSNSINALQTSLRNLLGSFGRVAVQVVPKGEAVPIVRTMARTGAGQGVRPRPPQTNPGSIGGLLNIGEIPE